MLRVLDLFSGIGCFSLGLERTGGFKTVAFCEIDKAAQRVLQKHWPSVPIYQDVTKLKSEHLPEIDVICGGFPCQDISSAGNGGGLDGERSGLWWEYRRLIKELKPQYAIIENVALLRRRGLGEVLRSLSEIGYDAEWHCIPASAVGAPHQRDRLWIIAYSQCLGPPRSGRCIDAVYSTPNAFEEASGIVNALQGKTLPYVCGRHDGGSSPVDRLTQLGNSLVPQIPELIGKGILNWKK